MKILKIDNKEYKIEYSIEASLCSECTEKVSSLLVGFSAETENEAKKNFVSTIADIPSTTFAMFYAGLLENHGEDGDRSVRTRSDAKKLIKKYIEETQSSFYELMEILIDEMGESGFFEMIGLGHLMERVEKATKQANQTKKPQDHKKKSTKVTEM